MTDPETVRFEGGIEPIEASHGGYDPLRDELEEEHAQSRGQLEQTRFAERLTETLSKAAQALDHVVEDGRTEAETPWIPFGRDDIGFVEIKLIGTPTSVPEAARWFEILKKHEYQEPKVFIEMGIEAAYASRLGTRKGQSIGHSGFNYAGHLLRKISDSVRPKPAKS